MMTLLDDFAMPARAALGALLLLSSAQACGDDTKSQPNVLRYLPVQVGNHWTYDEVATASGAILGTIDKEITGTRDLDGRNTFVHVTTQTNSLVAKRSFWLADESHVFRLKQERLDAGGTLLDWREYDPGFLRLGRETLELGQTYAESHVRSEYASDGTLVDQRSKAYTWVVEALDESVTVPAGTFSCLRLRRVDSDVGVKTYYYAKDVGKVLEHDDIEEEQLREVSLVN